MPCMYNLVFNTTIIPYVTYVAASFVFIQSHKSLLEMNYHIKLIKTNAQTHQTHVGFWCKLCSAER